MAGATHQNPPLISGAEDRISSVEIRPEAPEPTSTILPPPSISFNPRHQIRFRHPHYPHGNNILLSLLAPDHPDGGLEYGVAHAACGVVSGSRWDGWFTTTVDGPRLTLTYGNILFGKDYYFYLPNSTFECPYAVVPSFKEWLFPHDNLHPCWNFDPNPDPSPQSRLAAPSLFSAAVIIRDQSCRMSGCVEGTQAAHLVPKSEEVWFKRNRMAQHNLNPLVIRTPLDDTANAVLLRQDLHSIFDDHKFLFVPKQKSGSQEINLLIHLLIGSRELGTLYHNVRLKPIADVSVAFLFARFAWSIFTLLPGFLEVGVERNLCGLTISAKPGVPQIFTADECRNLIPGGKSRSQSPAKRVRRRSDAELEGEAADEGTRQYKRQKKDDVMEENMDGSSATAITEDVVTPNLTGDLDVLRNSWLKRERLRSDPQNSWTREEAWARFIREDDQVMGPQEVARLYAFYGHEERNNSEEGGGD